MDYIKLAEELGINKNIAIKIYKSFNGGYFIQIYYSKPPILYKLKDWPKLYLNFKNYYLFNNIESEKAFSLLVYIDIFSIYGMSYYLKRENLNINKIINETKEIFNKIEDKASETKVNFYPRFVEDFPYNLNINPLINDLIRRRAEEINGDLRTLLNEIVYDSKVMEEVRRKYPWAKSIRRENSIKAISLAGMLDSLIKFEFNTFLYLIFSKSLYFDELVTSTSITNTINIINSIDINNISRINNEKIKNQIDNLLKTIKEIATYY
ncbi:MAG: hypothetical protein QXV69_03760 [Sulfolobaceae archaeon]